jgi:hypothetical protein
MTMLLDLENQVATAHRAKLAYIEYESWRWQQPVSLAATDRAQILSLGEDLPKLWGVVSAVERKQILRLVMKEVILDQRPASGQVWIRVIWQSGAVSEHKIRRNVNSYHNYADITALEARVPDLVAAKRWTAKSQQRSTRKAFCPRTGGRSAAVRCICCANVGLCATTR